MKENEKMEDIKQLNLEDLDGIAGGTDPEDMSLNELNSLIQHFENLESDLVSQLAADPIIHRRDIEGSLGATRNAIVELKKIRMRRFGV